MDEYVKMLPKMAVVQKFTNNFLWFQSPFLVMGGGLIVR